LNNSDFYGIIKLSSLQFEADDSIFPTTKLESILVPITAISKKINKEDIHEHGQYPVVTQEANVLISGYTDEPDPIKNIPLIIFGDHSCSFKFIDFPFFRGADGTQLIKVDEDKANLKYVFYFLSFATIPNRTKYERHFKYLKALQIPLPPMSTQQQIVTECEAEDRKYDECNKKIESLANQKAEIVGSISTNEITTIEALCDEINPSRSEISNLPDDTSVSFVEMNSLGQGIIEKMVDRPLGELRKGGYTYFAENDILIAKITPCMENGKCAIASGLTNGIGMGSTEFHVFRVNKSKVMPEYVFALLNQDKIRKEAAAHFTGSSGHRRVPVDYYKHLEIPFLSLQEQKRIVKQIYGIDQQVITLKVRMQECATIKQAILDKYLK